MIWKVLTQNKSLLFEKTKIVSRRVGFSCDAKKHAPSKLDLKSALQAFSKYDLESVLQIKDAFGLK